MSKAGDDSDVVELIVVMALFLCVNFCVYAFLSVVLLSSLLL